MVEVTVACTAEGGDDGEERFLSLIRFVDLSWLPATLGLGVDAGERSGLRRISSDDHERFVEQLIEVYRRDRAILLWEIRQRLEASPAEVEDVLNEVVRRMCANPPRLTGELGAYLRQAVRNEALTRQEQARRRRAQHADLEEGNDFKAPGVPFEDLIVIRMVLAKAFARLSLRQRQLVELVYCLGWSQLDASTELGIAANTARSYLFEARKILRDDPGIAGLLDG